MLHLMRSFTTCAPAAAMMVGGSDTKTTTTEHKVSGPEGETTVTQEMTVEKSGDNPPAVRP